MKNIAVYGLGRVGLVTALCFAKQGCHVSGFDTDPVRLSMIQRGGPPFSEPGLEEYLKAVVGRNFVIDADRARAADIVFITVGTPAKRYGVELSYVRAATTQIGQSLRESDRCQLVVVKSTVPPGTTRNVVKPILESESGRLEARGEFRLCANPEFLREGECDL